MATTDVQMCEAQPFKGKKGQPHHVGQASGQEDTEVHHEESDLEFILIASIFQAILLILYAVSSDYWDSTKAHSDDYYDPEHGHDHEFETQPYYFYAMFQDVHAMMFIGFGFLMTFLRKYGFGALSYNFILCAFGIQWGMYIFWMTPWLFGEGEDKLHVTAYKLIDGDIATAVVLISFGALLGRTNPGPLLVMCFLELIVWAVNFHICIEYLGIVDVGGSIVVHVFGAYFGLAVSKMYGKPTNDEENKSMYHSDMFAMIGSLFLWLYWPSFNGFFASREYFFMDRAFVNTVLGLCGATVATFIVSRLVKGKFDMVHIQNATLAGGVAVGAAADLYLHPAGALGIGMVGGTISVCGYEYLSDWMDTKLGIADTCGVHNLHGMPGVLGGIVSAIAIAVSEGSGVYVSQCASNPNDNGIGCEGYPFGENTYQQQAQMQIAALVVTIAMAVVSGLVTGFFLKQMARPKHEYCDEDNFEVPAGKKDFLRGTIRGPQFAGRDLDALDALDAVGQDTRGKHAD